MTNRRDFIKTTAALAGTMSIPSFLMSGCNKAAAEKRIGLQIYSVRDALGEDIPGTMQKVADIGYKNIEAYSMGSDGKFLNRITAKDFKKLCDDMGMRIVSTHSSYFQADQAQGYIDTAKEVELDIIGIPYIPGDMRTSIDDYKKIAANLNAVGEECAKAGLQCAYHNHAFELEAMDGQLPLEVLIEETDPNNVSFEFDLFWITRAGADPLALVNKYPGRVSCFHVKDATKDLEGTTVGQGIIDFAGIFKANKSSLVYSFVEDERTDTPFENIKAAYDYLAAANFTG